jgi:hypothetical protein
MTVLKISQIEVNEEKQQWWFVEPYDEIFQEYDSIDGYPAHIKDKVEEIISKKIGDKKVKVTVFSYKGTIGNYDILA